MNYATSGGVGFFHWLFTLNGILSILILAGMIYLIARFVQNSKSKNNSNQQKKSSSSGENIQPYDSEMESEKSFWDDFNVNQQNPQREEEPIPPNAIPPSTIAQTPTQVMMFQEESDSKDVNGLWEKDCGKDMIQENSDSNVVNINKDEKGE